MRKLQHKPGNGSGLLAIFCDLAAVDQADFRPWLIEDMFPARQKIGFKDCASFNLIDGKGSEFVTLYETPSIGHLYGLPYQNLRQTRNPRDQNYHNKFQSPQRYTLNWVGPEISKKINGFSKYIIISRFDLKDWLIPDFNIWFVCTYIPSLLNTKNIVGLRRFISLEGPHKNFVIKEILKPQKSDVDNLRSENKKFETHITGTYERIIQIP